MLHPQLFNLAKYASEKHKPSITSVITNGTLLNEFTALKIIDSHLTKIYISLDAASPETFLKVRGKDCFNKIIDGIRALIDLRNQKSVKRPIIGLMFIILEENKDALLNLHNLQYHLKLIL